MIKNTNKYLPCKMQPKPRMNKRRYNDSWEAVRAGLQPGDLYWRKVNYSDTRGRIVTSHTEETVADHPFSYSNKGRLYPKHLKALKGYYVLMGVKLGRGDQDGWARWHIGGTSGISIPTNDLDCPEGQICDEHGT